MLSSNICQICGMRVGWFTLRYGNVHNLRIKSSLHKASQYDIILDKMSQSYCKSETGITLPWSMHTVLYNLSLYVCVAKPTNSGSPIRFDTKKAVRYHSFDQAVSFDHSFDQAVSYHPFKKVSSLSQINNKPSFISHIPLIIYYRQIKTYFVLE